MVPVESGSAIVSFLVEKDICQQKEVDTLLNKKSEFWVFPVCPATFGIWKRQLRKVTRAQLALDIFTYDVSHRACRFFRRHRCSCL